MASLGPGWALGTHITNHPPLRTEQHIDSARLVSCPQPSCRPAPQLVSLGLAEELSGKDGLSLREQTVQERRSHRREVWGWGGAQSPSGPNSAASPGPRASSLPPGEGRWQAKLDHNAGKASPCPELGPGDQLDGKGASSQSHSCLDRGVIGLRAGAGGWSGG